MTPELLPLAVIVLVAWTTQAMTGFGSIVIALTLGALLLPIRELLPVLVALNLPLCAQVVWREHRHIDRPLLLQAILPLMTTGVVLGIVVSPWLDGPLLRRGFGLMVTAVAARTLLGMAWGRTTQAAGPWRTRLLLLGSGITHGIWASGGPLLVLALDGLTLPRANFRATLMAVWLGFNVVLLATQAVSGVWTTTAAIRVLVLLPLLPIGITLGEWLHHRVPDTAFRAVVQGVLLIAGIALLR